MLLAWCAQYAANTHSKVYSRKQKISKSETTNARWESVPMFYKHDGMKDSFQPSLSLHKYLIEKLVVYREYAMVCDDVIL